MHRRIFISKIGQQWCIRFSFTIFLPLALELIFASSSSSTFGPLNKTFLRIDNLFYEFVYQFRATRITVCPIEFNRNQSFCIVQLWSFPLVQSGPLKKCWCLDWRKLTSVRITHKRNRSSGINPMKSLKL